MVSSGTSVKTSKSEKEKEKEKEPRPESSSRHNRLFNRLSNRNVFDELGSRFFNLNSTEAKSLGHKNAVAKDKLDKVTFSQVRNPKRLLFTGKLKEDIQGNSKKNDRDFRRFRSRYNSCAGNILREWVNLIYCILILRMNLIKFIVDKFPDFSVNDIHLQKQILLESKTIYKTVRKAQHYSQEQFLYLWSHLDKLIINRMVLKGAMDAIQLKETGLRDWKAASEKLAQLQQDLGKAQASFKAIQRSKTQFEVTAKEKIAKLESLAHSKNAEMEQLVQQISDLKNNEVQMKGKILLNMKNYNDLKSKKQDLMSIEKDMIQLKNDQSILIKDYTMRIESLKNQVKQKEKQIKAETEERKRIKATLIGFGDFSEKQSLIRLQES